MSWLRWRTLSKKSLQLSNNGETTYGLPSTGYDHSRKYPYRSYHVTLGYILCIWVPPILMRMSIWGIVCYSSCGVLWPNTWLICSSESVKRGHSGNAASVSSHAWSLKTSWDYSLQTVIMYYKLRCGCLWVVISQPVIMSFTLVVVTSMPWST